MTPENTKAHDEALEALVAASLRASEKEPEITEEEISRYVDQSVTLSAEDEQALQNSESALKQEIARILRTKPLVPTTGKTDTINANCVSRESMSGKRRRAPQEFVEAVVIAQITRLHSSNDHPLGRKRYQKLAYLSHRKAEDDVTEHYQKKAAGPYSPWARYQGPERIALNNGYVARAQAGVYQGLVVGTNIGEIDAYLSRYPVCTAVSWIVDQFRYRKNDDLELLTTVDFAALELNCEEKAVTVESVKQIIATNAEWKAKLSRELFSDAHVSGAIDELRKLFPATYGA